MPDNDDVNGMQAHLGLSGGAGSLAPFGMPTPMPPPPMMRHPSDAARDAVQMTQTAAMNTMQTAQTVNMAAGGGMGGGGGGGGGWGLGAFANQYRQNMAGIQQQQLNPWMAGSMASMTGAQGYMPGMMPSPVQMTPPNMGIYRAPPPMPMGQIPPVPPMPLFPTPFSPQMPQGQFQTPLDRSLQMGEMRGIQHTALALSLPGIAGRAGADVLGSRVGAGFGAAIGARFGPAGAAIGSTVGAIGGLLGTDQFLGQGIQGAIDHVNPFSAMAHRTAQIRGMSQEFVIGGSGMSAGGRGLGASASAHLARKLHDVAGDSGFQRETGSQFSTQDLMKITQTSGQQGLLDMAQRPDQIAGQVKNIAKALKSFMQLASEPDVTEALKQLGQMKHMGLSLSESMGAMQNAKMFSRMAGTSVRGIMESGGLPGAMTFQQQGLSAGLGLQVGMGAMGMARQAVAGGTFTDRQLATLGGVQGVAQRSMESAAATLKQPLMAAAMSGIGAGGTFGLNAGSVQGLAQGQVGIQQMANMGVNNMLSAVQKQGLSGLAAFQMDQNQVSDDLGRALGPIRTNLMPLQQGLKTMKFLGLKGAGGLFAGFKAMGMDDDTARQKVSEANSPEYFQNMQRQINITRQDDRAREFERREAADPTLADKIIERSSTIRGARNIFRDTASGLRDVVEGGVAGMGQWGQESAARRVGQTIIRTPAELLASSPMETRRLMERAGEAFGPGGGPGGATLGTGAGVGSALFHTPGGRPVGQFAAVGAVRDFLGGDSFDLEQYRKRQGGLKGLLGGGNAETAARFLGGGLVMASGEEVRDANKRERGVAESINNAISAGAVSKEQSSGRITKQFGEKTADIHTAYSSALADAAKKRFRVVGGGKLLAVDKEAALEAAAKAAGVSVDKMRAFEGDLATTNMGTAKGFAGTAGTAFEQDAIVDKGTQQAQLDTAMTQRRELGENRMGSVSTTGRMVAGFAAGSLLGPMGAAVGMLVGGFNAIGAEGRQSEAMTAMFSGDADTGLLTSMYAAVLENPDDQGLRAKYEKEKQRVRQVKGGKGQGKIEDAEKAATNAGKLRPELAKAGQSYGEEKDAAAAFKKDQETDQQRKIAVAASSGQRALLKDKSLIGMGEHDILSKGPGGLAGEDQKIQDLAKRYKAAKTDEERGKIAGEFRRMEVGASTATPEELQGGALGGDEKKAAADTAAVAAAAADAASNFPQAVASFAEATKALQEAAEHLGSVKVTSLSNGKNDSWFWE